MRLGFRLPMTCPISHRGKTNRTQHYNKRRYQKGCWIAAVGQHKPPRDPPRRVRIDAVLHGTSRDPDHLENSLKWVLDALKQVQRGKDWRGGLYSRCGYFIDDDDRYIVELNVAQNRARRGGQWIELWIEEI